MDDFMKLIGYLVAAIGIVVGIAVITAFPVMVMWNYLIPELFGLKSISFLSKGNRSVLCSTLFECSSSGSGKS